jgi:cytolysin (calcineurin-like family phosphatase)
MYSIVCDKIPAVYGLRGLKCFPVAYAKQNHLNDFSKIAMAETQFVEKNIDDYITER